MRRTAKGRDSDLGCLLQSAIIAVLLIALTAYSLSQLEDLIHTEESDTVAQVHEEAPTDDHGDPQDGHGDEETSADEHDAESDGTASEESSADDHGDETTAGDHTDQEATTDDQTDQQSNIDTQEATEDSGPSDQGTTADEQSTTEDTAATDDQTDQQPTTDTQDATEDSGTSDEETATTDEQSTTGNESSTDNQTDQQSTTDAQDTSQENTSDEQTTGSDDVDVASEGGTDQETTAEDQGDQEPGSLETADSAVDTSDDEAKDPEEGVVAGSDTMEVSSETQETEYAPDVVAEGESLYVLCSACHGPDARGLPGLGLSLIDSEMVGTYSDEELRDFVIVGRPVWDPNNSTGIDMPARGGNPVLTDEDILKIIAYIRTLRTQVASGEEPVSQQPSPEMAEADIVALGYDPAEVAEGETLYVLCSACHGPDALGLPGLGHDLLGSEFVDSLDDDALRDFVVVGRPVWDPTNTSGVDMPPRGGNPVLTDEDILKIIAYIRVLDAQMADSGEGAANPETSTDPAPTITMEFDPSAAGYEPTIVSEGEGLYILCAACHGPDARGLPGLGLDLIEGQFLDENTDESLLEFVLVGRPVWDPANTSGVDMPPKGGNPALTDEDILKIVAYIRTLRANVLP